MAVSVDDVPVGVVTADMFRADVHKAGFGDGSYGFALRLDMSGVNVEGKQIRVRVEDENYELPNSPWTIPTPFGSSYSSLPWVESPVFAELNSKVEDPDRRDMAQRYHDEGFVVLEGLFDDALLDSARVEVGEAFAQDLQDDGTWRPRLQDVWEKSDACKQIATDPKILDVLGFLYEREPVPFQTLNFHCGTQQPAHSDIIHFHSMPRRFMCGVWVALEDISPDSGPLFYYPGSHNLPDFNVYDMGMTATTWDYPDYEAFMEGLMASHTFEKKYLNAKKGTALIWSANLVHGGSTINDPSSTRWSQVSHYYFEDCVYYTPLVSNMVSGEYRLREITNICTDRVAPNRYNDHPTTFTRLPNGLFRVQIGP